MDAVTENKPESEYMRRVKQLEECLREIHGTALNYADDAKSDLPNEKRFRFLAFKCLKALSGK